MSNPVYVLHYDAHRSDGTAARQVLKWDGQDYMTYLTLATDWNTSDKAREVVRGLNELEKRRARDRREAARRRKERG